MILLRTPLAVALAAMPIAAFAAGPADHAAMPPKPMAREAAAPAERAAADLRHAAHDLSSGADRAMRLSAGLWIERAETELLNRASLEAKGQTAPAQDPALAHVTKARAELAKGDPRTARADVEASLQALRSTPKQG